MKTIIPEELFEKIKDHYKVDDTIKDIKGLNIFQYYDLEPEELESKKKIEALKIAIERLDDKKNENSTRPEKTQSIVQSSCLPKPEHIETTNDDKDVAEDVTSIYSIPPEKPPRNTERKAGTLPNGMVFSPSSLGRL